jgi:hypothetical protein
VLRIAPLSLVHLLTLQRKTDFHILKIDEFLKIDSGLSADRFDCANRDLLFGSGDNYRSVSF